MKVNNEKGVFSAVYLIFLVTLGLMGMGAFMLVRSEGQSVAVQSMASKVKYAANGAVYYGLRQLEQGALDESTALGVGAVNVILDSVLVGDELHMFVNASQDDLKSRLRIRMKPRSLADYAVYLQGTATNINPKDSLDNLDYDLMADNVSSMPAIDNASLYALSTAQGNDQFAATFKPANGYGGSFYRADGVTPNVHHVCGDMNVLGGRTIYGLFVVDGSITIAGSARVIGVIYVVNPMATLILGGGSPTGASITGGIVSHGDLFGTGSHIDITHKASYMKTFAQWSGPIAGFRLLAWDYL